MRLKRLQLLWQVLVRLEEWPALGWARKRVLQLALPSAGRWALSWAVQ
ncbi:hypothetical protein [Salinispora tropica]|nr:hypothetical protein [Salinispora tropica]